MGFAAATQAVLSPAQVQRAEKHLRLEPDAYIFGGKKRREQITAEAEAILDELPPLLEAAEREGVDAAVVAEGRVRLSAVRAAKDEREAAAQKRGA